MTAGRKNSGTTVDYCTPQKYADVLHNFWDKIDLDPCSNPYSIIEADEKIMLPRDGLTAYWGDASTIFVNPPYGRGIDKWVKKCISVQEDDYSEVIALIPVATSTKYWQQLVLPTARAICFLADARVPFTLNGEKTKGSPMACALVFWSNTQFNTFEEHFKKLGRVINL